jgi:hypothetical protein
MHECEAPRPQGGASRKGSFVHIVPLDPAYKAGSRGTFRPNDKVQMSTQTQSTNLENIRILEFDICLTVGA